MNYIKKLQKENDSYKKFLKELEGYLNLSKFAWPDDYVNVKDIVIRINELNQELRRK